MTPTFRHWFHWYGGLIGWSSLILIIGFMTAKAQEPPALPTSPCGPFQAFPLKPFLGVIGGKFGQKPAADALAGDAPNQVSVHIWVNSQTGSWSIFGTPIPGVACIMANGDHFGPPEPVTDPVPDEPQGPGTIEPHA